MIVSHFFCLIFKAIVLPIFVHSSYYPAINVCFELCGESHLRATLYNLTLD